MDIRSRSVIANGLRHHVYEWGPAEGERGTVLLLHGFMDTGASWELVAPHLVERLPGVRLVAPDLRGFGDSDRAPPGSYYHFADYIADVADLVQKVVAAESPLFVVGHSMGGTVATLYAGAEPDRVKRLALLEGVGPPDNTFDRAPERMRDWLIDLRRVRRGLPMRSFDKALERLSMNHPNVDRGILRGRVARLLREDLTWKTDPLHRTRSPLPFYAAAFREFAKSVTCPVLVLDGGPSGFKTPDHEERVAAFGHVVCAELAEAGHMMHWTAPVALADVLADFLGGEGVT